LGALASSKRSRRSLTGRGRVAIGIAVTAAFWFSSSAIPALAATPTADASTCLPATQGVTVHFLLSNPARSVPEVAGVTLHGFDEDTCDGQPVTVTLSGNQAGNPAAPATDVLSSFDSTVNACSGKALTDPVFIKNDSITLRGCQTTNDPALGAYADVHDLTLLRVEVNGHEVETGPRPKVLGTEVFANGESGTSAGHAAIQGTSGLLPFTGGLSSLWFWIGVLCFMFGLVSLLIDRFTETRAAVLGLVSRSKSHPGD
jgi:phage tail sheath protein FI